jgi:hypothetical protein
MRGGVAGTDRRPTAALDHWRELAPYDGVRD